MNLTPKNIVAKLGYTVAGVLGIIGLIFFVPGGLLILAAFIIGSRSDSLESEEYDPEGDTTIEQYEKDTDYRSGRDNEDIWKDFYAKS